MVMNCGDEGTFGRQPMVKLLNLRGEFSLSYSQSFKVECFLPMIHDPSKTMEDLSMIIDN